MLITFTFIVIFPIVTGGAALIFTAAVSGTSILPTVVAGAGGLGLLGIGRIQMQLVKDGLIRT